MQGVGEEEMTYPSWGGGKETNDRIDFLEKHIELLEKRIVNLENTLAVVMSWSIKKYDWI